MSSDSTERGIVLVRSNKKIRGRSPPDGVLFLILSLAHAPDKMNCDISVTPILLIQRAFCLCYRQQVRDIFLRN